MNKETLKTHLLTGCRGDGRAVSAATLRQSLHVSENELRKQVNRLRREAVPIANSAAGYFYAETAGEVYATIRHLRKMREGLDGAIAGLEQALEHFGETR